MRHSPWSIASAMILGACTMPGVHDDLGGDDIATGTVSGEPASGGPDWSPPACGVTGAPGMILQQLQLDPDAGLAVLVANGSGDLAYAGKAGITRLAPDLHVLFTYPFGVTVALDKLGNAFIAGSFTDPTDFGTGMLTPGGNVDVFLVELSPAGDVIFARTLGVCGDGVESIAVARDGRIAISGRAFGTAVTDAAGNVVFVAAQAGKVAFDSHGTLIVGGSLVTSTDTDALVSAFDGTGQLVFSVRLGDAAGSTPHVQTITGVAIDRTDRIAITGAFREEMDLFGEALHAQPDFPSGSIAGTFVASLDATGGRIFAEQGPDSNASIRFGGVRVIGPTGVDRAPGTAIAVDIKGNVVVSTSDPGNAQPPFAYPQLTQYANASGDIVVKRGSSTDAIGFGLGVTVDACGEAVWATFENAPSLLDPHTLLSRIAL